MALKDKFGNTVFLPLDFMTLDYDSMTGEAMLSGGTTFKYRITPVVTCKHCGGENLRKLDMSVPEEFIDARDDEGNTFFCRDCDVAKNAIRRLSHLQPSGLPREQSEEEIAEKWNAMQGIDNQRRFKEV